MADYTQVLLLKTKRKTRFYEGLITIVKLSINYFVITLNSLKNNYKKTIHMSLMGPNLEVGSSLI